MLSDPSTDCDSDNEAAAAAEINVPENGNLESLAEYEENPNEEENEDWEADLDVSMQGPKAHVRDWTDLQKQIKDHLRKNSKTLPLSRLNQLLIISNFVTLQKKGVSCTWASHEIAQQWHKGQGNWFAQRVCALARHYQISKPFQLRDVVALEIQDHGCMMSESRSEHGIGSPHRKRAMSHHTNFKMH